MFFSYDYLNIDDLKKIEINIIKNMNKNDHNLVATLCFF